MAPVVLWGTGRPRRELLHVDDLAEAVVYLLEHVAAADLPDGLVNVGTGRDQTIRELAELTQRVVGHTGPIEWDASKPDGTPQKQLDMSRITALGWRPQRGSKRASARPTSGTSNTRPAGDGAGPPAAAGSGRRTPERRPTGGARGEVSGKDGTHHRRHRAGRRLSGRAPARAGLRGARHQAPRQPRSTPTASTTSTTTRTRPACASSCTTAT